jgi:hypothetical protein
MLLGGPTMPKLGQHDPELVEWLVKAWQDGGGFVQAIASAGLRADAENQSPPQQ